MEIARVVTRRGVRVARCIAARKTAQGSRGGFRFQIHRLSIPTLMESSPNTERMKIGRLFSRAA